MMTVGQFLRDKLLFEDPQPRRFVTSQCFPDVFYLVWTTFWSLWNTVFQALDPYFLGRRGLLPDNLWFVYLTHWGYIVLTLGVLTDCVTSFYVQFRRKDILNGYSTEMPWYLKMSWCLYNVGISTAAAITILYFAFLGLDLQINSINFHVINTVYVVLNLFVTNKPMKILHLVYPVIFSIIYMSFSAIHQSATGIVLYAALDWTKLSRTLPLVLVLTFVGVPILHLIAFGTTKLREHVCCKSNSENENTVV